MQYWLMKSEPDVFGIDDLANCPNKTDHWDGIRNYMARNFMRDEMKVGDAVLFYHSNAKPPHVAGLAEIVSAPYPDHTAWDAESHYFDPKSSPENPRWVMVDVKFIKKFENIVPLADIKANPELEKMMLRTHGRLSISKVNKNEWDEIFKMAGEVH